MYIWNRRHPANELVHPAHPAHPGYPGNPGNRVHPALIKYLCFRITDTALLALNDFNIDDFVSIKCKGIKSRIVLCMALPSGCSSGHPDPFGVCPAASIAYIISKILIKKKLSRIIL